MEIDTDDTVLSAPRLPASAPGEPDTHDTVLSVPRGAAAPAVIIDDAPSSADAVPLPGGPAAATGPIATVAYGVRVAGMLVPLDRDVLVGRRPSPPRITAGPPPRLVAVPSPTSDVSRTHLQVRQLGASVVVTDLRSTNGSVVHVPGAAPRTLRQGEAMVVTAGTRIELGDEIVVEVHRLQPEESA